MSGVTWQQLLEADPHQTPAEWHPRPRYAPKCGQCGRFVPKSSLRSFTSLGSYERVTTGECSRCGREEVW